MVFTGSTSRRTPATWRYLATAIVATLVLCTACSRGDDEVESGGSSSSTAPSGTGENRVPATSAR